MRTNCKILPLVLLATLVSLSSCVNEIKNPTKTQTQDTTKGKDSIGRLAINYNIPDSNNILSVAFHASMTPSMPKNFRLDWDFGDSSGIFSRFDTNNIAHNFKGFGLHIVSLSVIDTQTKAIVSKTSDTLVLIDNAIDTNYLHQFEYIKIFFTPLDTNLFFYPVGECFSNPVVTWNGNFFHLVATCDWDYGSYQNWNLDQGTEQIEFSGHISYSGNQIDSGSLIYYYYDYQAPRGGFLHASQGTILKYEAIPLSGRYSNSLEFSFSGPDLQNKIQAFRDSSYTQANLITNYHEATYQDILWGQKPPITLTIIFYK